MSILELLTGKKKKRAKAHLSNLLAVAASDGSFDGLEVDYLLSMAQRYNITEEEVKNIKDNPEAFQYDPPTNDRERFDHLHHLVCMMLIDGEVHDREIEICKRFATTLGLKQEFVDDFIQVIQDDPQRETPTEVVIGKLLKLAQEREMI
ncbi:hypothetical protein PZB74_22480 [Porifericola rhodea]|uniref:hypothetical protein n=1 Tax=Porifericola rhodea TaxID=930972 RepID=UPI002665DA30|nr:hypothetical protein [Porifericola rhodea]WKN31716.1 hypothetical protein PZB74_22480 [Porifericola rhodea]